MMDLYSMHKKGEDAPADAQTAMQWLRRAANAGHLPAVTQLGIENLQGELVPPNSTFAAELFEQAGSKGDAAGMMLLGELYAIGHGVAQSRDMAREWLAKAKAAGRAKEVAEVPR